MFLKKAFFFSVESVVHLRCGKVRYRLPIHLYCCKYTLRYDFPQDAGSWQAGGDWHQSSIPTVILYP